jgi:N-acetylglucosaminyl-diphospho-decaprenol L-rhamnosyltransferase
MNKPILSFSIVSHGQIELIEKLLNDIYILSLVNIEIIITFNIPENFDCIKNFPLPLRIIKNNVQKGFGENHNSAFLVARGRYFIVVNPDIRIFSFDIDKLVNIMSGSNIGALAPQVLNSDGGIEDSIRKFPTILDILKRIFFRSYCTYYIWGDEIFDVDWAGGMFVVFNRHAFESVNGFDNKRFFMYYEDVDICQRLWGSGWRVIANPNIKVVHDAQRASRSSFKHLKWHLNSAVRYLLGF